MKTRVISGVIGVAFLAIVIYVLPTSFFGAVVGAISTVGVLELYRSAKKGTPPRVQLVTALLAVIMPFSTALGQGEMWTHISIFLVSVYLFSEMLISFKNEKPMPFEVVAIGIVAGFVIPYFLTSLIRLDMMGWAYVSLPFLISFASDSCAYFVGVSFGRHKLVPILSPKKSIEGSFGGFLGTIAVLMIYGLILSAQDYEVNYALLAVYGFLGSLTCQFGDLCFSAIKRLSGIKDFGNLIPGHGGILDRFDGMIFVVALVEILVLWAPAFTK